MPWQVVANHSDVVAGCNDAVARRSNAIAGHSDVVAGCNDAVAGCSNAIAGHSDVVAGCNDAVAGCSNAVAGRSDAMAGRSNAVAGRTANVTEHKWSGVVVEYNVVYPGMILIDHSIAVGAYVYGPIK